MGCPHMRTPATSFLRCFRNWRALLAAGLMLLALAPSFLPAQTSKKPLAKNDVIELLEGDVPAARVAEIAGGRGISFEMTAQTESDLRGAGADDALIQTLRKLAPRPAAPPSGPSAAPVLMIEATPGGAQVYVDDEPVGTTSSEGRLKLTRYAPGDHRVRLSLQGYRDYEQTVTLVGGQTASVGTVLQAAPVPGAQTSSTSQAGAGGTPHADGATLGLRLALHPPAGTRGVLISDVAPGGPADLAKIRPGYSVLSIGGHAVNTPQQVQQVMASLQAGMVVNVTYWDGSATYTTGARLVPRSSLAFPSSSPRPATSQSSAQGSGATAGTGGVISLPVVHDHGPPAPNYCAGIMTIGQGMVSYRSSNGMHSFDIPVSAIREARRNAVYLANYHAFHIRLKKGTLYNFAVINSNGQYQPPDALLDAIDRAMSGQ